MAKIHLIDGEKGGVGKSLFCRVLIEYFQSKSVSYSLIDADRTNPDVGLIYQPQFYGKNDKKVVNNESILKKKKKKNAPHDYETSKGNVFQEDQNISVEELQKLQEAEKEEISLSEQEFEPIFFSEDERKSYTTDLIFEKAIKEDVIVNLPAQVAPLVNHWIEKNSLLTLGQEMKVSFCKWFICTGGYDSISLFKDSLNLYQDQLQHILVRNGGLCDSWSHLEEDIDLMNWINKYKVKVIDFPKLSYRERNLIDAQKWTFSSAKNQAQLGIISKQRIKLFLDQSFAQITLAIS